MKILIGVILFSVGVYSGFAKNLINGDSSFETGYGIWHKTGVVDHKTAYDGNRSLKISQNLKSQANFEFKPGQKYYFTVYLKTEKDATPVTLTAYRTNWMGNNIVKHIRVGKEWKRYTLEIPPQTIDTHNTVWLMINPGGKTLWVDACQLEAKEQTSYKAAEAVSIACKALSPVDGNIFFPDEKKEILLSVFNSLPQNTKLRIFCSVTDFYGNIAMNKSRDIDIVAKKSKKVTFEMENLYQKGFFLIKYGFAKENGQLQEKEASMCIVDRPLPFSVPEGSLFGMCGSSDETIPALGRIGVKWAPIAIRWPMVYPACGKVDERYLNEVEKQIDLRRKHGINAVGYLRRTASWAAVKSHPYNIYPPKKKFVKDYEAYVFKVISRFKDKVKLWQLWGGETDLLCDLVTEKTNLNQEDFIDVLVELYKAGYQGAKRADSNCIVGTGGVSGVDCEKGFKLSSKVLTQAKGFYDEFVMHPYCYPSQFGDGKRVQSPEEHFLTDIYKKATKVSGGDIWNGEYGFAIDSTERLGSPASKKMAAYMLRSYLLSATVPKVKRVMWHTVSNNIYSIWNWPNPRPLVAAYAALAQILTHTKNPREIHLGSYIRGYTFTKGTGSVAALWIPENKNTKICFADVEDIKIVDAMGNILPAVKTITLSGMPLYLLSDKSDKYLRDLIEKSQIMLRPVEVKLRFENSQKLNIYLTNQLNQEINGTVKLKLGTAGNGNKVFYKKFSRLRPGVPEKIVLNIPDINISKLEQSTISGEVLTDKGKIKFSKKTELLQCPYIAKVKIDGNLYEWQNRPFIELKTTKYLSPYDAFSHGLWHGESDLSVKAYTGWDKNNFYFAARVTDDLFVNNNSVRRMWAGDCIQLAFDCLNDAITPGYKNDDYEFTLGLNTENKQGLIYQSWPLPPFIPQADIAVKREGKYIYYELALPFKYIRPFMPLENRIFGFNFAVLDNDYQKVEYWLALSNGICGGKNPSFFKKFILTK
jgi:hypothetical protein